MLDKEGLHPQEIARRERISVFVSQIRDVVGDSYKEHNNPNHKGLYRGFKSEELNVDVVVKIAALLSDTLNGGLRTENEHGRIGMKIDIERAIEDEYGFTLTEDNTVKLKGDGYLDIVPNDHSGIEIANGHGTVRAPADSKDIPEEDYGKRVFGEAYVAIYNVYLQTKNEMKKKQIRESIEALLAAGLPISESTRYFLEA